MFCHVTCDMWSMSTFPVWMHPSEDSRFLRCTHLDMWSLNSMFRHVTCDVWSTSTFAARMHPSEDSKLLRCTHLNMWSLNSMFCHVLLSVLNVQMYYVFSLYYTCNSPYGAPNGSRSCFVAQYMWLDLWKGVLYMQIKMLRKTKWKQLSSYISMEKTLKVYNFVKQRWIRINLSRK